MAYVELKRGNLFFETVSDASAPNRGSLVFIHGAGGTHRKWSPLMDKSIKGLLHVALDLPGHGSSSGNPSDDVVAYAEAVKEFLDASGFPRPWILAGHSMGGSIALQTALLYPQAVDGLVLIGSGASMPVNPNMLEQLSKGTFDTSFLKIAYSRDIDPDLLASELKTWGQVSQQQLYIDFMACDKYNVSEQLPNIKTPVLILVGDQDKMAPVKSSQYLNENISGSILQLISGAGHHLMLEKPDETIMAISGFIDDKFPV